MLFTIIQIAWPKSSSYNSKLPRTTPLANQISSPLTNIGDSFILFFYNYAYRPLYKNLMGPGFDKFTKSMQKVVVPLGKESHLTTLQIHEYPKKKKKIPFSFKKVQIPIAFFCSIKRNYIYILV